MHALRVGRVSAPFVAALLVCGCAIPVRPPEPDYRLSAGIIGISVEPPAAEDLPTSGNFVGKGALGGAIAPFALAYAGPAGIAAGILLSPFTAAYGAARAASCGQKFTDAYPPFAAAIEDIVRREVVGRDVADPLAAELRKHTSSPVAVVDLPSAGSEEEDGARELLAAASRRDLAYVIVVTPYVYVTPDPKCEQARVGVRLKMALWNVAEARRVGLASRLHAWQHREVSIALSDLAPLFDEPAALRSRFVPLFEAWASDAYYQGGFTLTE